MSLHGARPAGPAPPGGRLRRALVRALGGPARVRVIVVLAAVLALDSADKATLGAVAPQLKHALHLTNTDFGVLASIAAVVPILGTLPMGVLVDRVRRTRLLALSVAVWCAAMALSGLSTSFGMLIGTRLFLGIVAATAGPAVASLTGDFFPPADRGRVYGYILTGELVGTGLGYVLAGNVAAALSWRAAFLLLTVPAVAVGVALWRLPEPARGGAGWLHDETGRPAAAAAAGAGRASSEGRSLAFDAVRAAGVQPDPAIVLDGDPRTMSWWSAVRYVLRVRTNVVLIVASSLGYFFFSGLRYFGVLFAKDQYRIGSAVAATLLPIVGSGAVAGVLLGGRLGDHLLARGLVPGRLLVAAGGFWAATAVFAPALVIGDLPAAAPLLLLGAAALAVPNPALDAARLDVIPPLLWGRAEAVRTMLRTAADGAAPLTIGFFSDRVAGGGHSGLRTTFLVMLVPLAAAGAVLVLGARRYVRDVASAAESVRRIPSHDG